MLVMFPADKP